MCCLILTELVNGQETVNVKKTFAPFLNASLDASFLWEKPFPALAQCLYFTHSLHFCSELSYSEKGTEKVGFTR